MKNFQLLTLGCLMTCLSPMSEAASAPSAYTVSQVVSVDSPVEFRCKLADYEPSRAVRFRVALNGLTCEDRAAGKAFLTELLDSAGTIELRNVRFRNYFRVEADLWVEGQAAAPILLANGWTGPLAGPQPGPDSPAAAAYQTRPPARTGAGAAMPNPPVVVRRVVTMRQLMETKVDCSMLTSETPLSEALRLLSESVNPPLPLVVLWSDLEQNALIEKDTPIGADGFATMPLSQALEIVLRSVSAGHDMPVLVSEGGILTLGMPQTLLKRNTRVYSIEDLMAAPAAADENNNSTNGSGNAYGTQSAR